MTGVLLRTGSLDVFHPLGADGNPVHAAAAQLRAAIGRRLGQQAADSFAVPQRNEDGDTIDWYAPRSGSVVPWSSATEEERTRAKECLMEIRERVEDLGRQMAAEPDPQRQAFARLLQHVTVFPDEEHVYLVDDRPVVTFWGFRHHNAPAYSGAMLNPDALAADRTPERPARRIPWWWWLLGLLLVLALLFFILRTCAPESAGPETETGDAIPGPVKEAGVPDGAGVMAEQLEELPAEEPRAETPVPEEPPLVPQPPPADPERGDPLPRNPESGSLRIEQELLERDSILREAASASESAGLTSGDADASSSVSVDEGVAEDLSATGDTGLLLEAETAEGTGVAEDSISPPQGETEPVAEEVAASDLDEAAALEPGAELAPLEQPPEAPAELEAQAPAPEIDQPASDAAAGQQEQPAQEIGPEEQKPAPELQQESQEPPAASVEPPAPQEPPASPDKPQTGEPVPGSAEASDFQAADMAAAPADQQAGAVPREPLTIPPEAVKTGSIRFTDGGWRTSTSLQDARGLPIEMSYQLKDGRGKVELRRHDGSVCSAGVNAAMSGGTLTIDSTTDITCPDGTNFGRPRMECTPGQDGRADCAGRYATGESFSVDMGKSP